MTTSPLPAALSFEQAITETQTILAQYQAEQLSPQLLQQAIQTLVQTDNGARGFFVTFLTAEACPLANQPTPEVLEALRSNPSTVSELLVKNLVMSAAMRIYHTRQQDETAVAGSKRVCRRTQKLIRVLNLPEIWETITQMNQSLDEQGSFTAFLERWEYDDKQRMEIRLVLRSTQPDT